MVTIEITMTEEEAWRLLQHANYQQRSVSEDIVAMLAQVNEWEWRRRQRAARRMRALWEASERAPGVAERHNECLSEGIMPEKREKGDGSDATGQPEGVG